MVKELRTAILVAMASAALLAACAPAQSPEQIQSGIGTGVALTVQAQNDMGTAVAQTLTAQEPLPSATSAPTLIPLSLPTLTALPTVTPFVVVPSGGGGGGGAAQPQYSCSFAELRPYTNVFYPGDPIYVVWLITNTGSRDWDFVRELNFDSGRAFLDPTQVDLPMLDSGERTTVTFDGNVPEEPGYYEMRYKVTGGLCFPYIDIQVVKRPGNDP